VLAFRKATHCAQRRLRLLAIARQRTQRLADRQRALSCSHSLSRRPIAARIVGPSRASAHLRRARPLFCSDPAARRPSASSTKTIVNVFGVESPARKYLTGIIEFAVRRTPRLQTVAVSAASDPFSREAQQGAIQSANDHGLRVVYTGQYGDDAAGIDRVATAIAAASGYHPQRRPSPRCLSDPSCARLETYARPPVTAILVTPRGRERLEMETSGVRGETPRCNFYASTRSGVGGCSTADFGQRNGVYKLKERYWAARNDRPRSRTSACRDSMGPPHSTQLRSADNSGTCRIIITQRHPPQASLWRMQCKTPDRRIRQPFATRSRN
jgi:hypothetical protein